MYLVVPKLRNGGYVLVQEACVNGVSTRKIEQLAKKLGVETLSTSQVSELRRAYQAQLREVPADPFRITGQEDQARHRRVGTDEETRKRTCSSASCLSVLSIDLPGEKKSLSRYLAPDKPALLQR